MVRLASFGAILLWAFLTSALSNVADLAIRPTPPAPVVAAVQTRFPGAIIVRAELEKQASAVYRLQMRSPAESGRTVTRDAWVRPGGEFLRAVRPVAGRDLPKPIGRALAARYPAGTVRKAVEITTDGGTRYEVRLATSARKPVDLECTPEGALRVVADGLASGAMKTALLEHASQRAE